MITRLLIGVLLASVAAFGAQPPSRAPHNAAEFDTLFQQVKNWGRWGPDDQLGSVNLITAAKRKQAAALVKTGETVSLAHTLLTEKADDNGSPFEHTMLRGNNMDRYAVQYHGYAHSHIDALCHILYKDQTYNGYARADVNTDKGCTKLGIQNLKAGLVTRGVLVDIPRLRNLPFLEPGTAIYVEDLEAWEKQAGVKVSAGDALFVRTGVWARRKAVGPWLRGRAEGGQSAGLHPSVLPWLKARDIALLGSDHPQYVAPGTPGAPRGAVHDFALVYLGVHLFDNCDLEALAQAAASRKRWEFLLTAAPLPIPGGTGSPLNPIATF